MDENLRKDIGLLLANHPELKNCRVVFSDSDFEMSAGNENGGATANEPTSPCEIREPFPHVITGPSPKIEIRESAIHGYGVFAKEPIKEGELIEQSKLLKLGLRSNYMIDDVLKDYVWVNSKCGCSECKKHGVNQYLALGFGSIFNYSKTPNTRLVTDFKTEIITIRALNTIEKDEEILVDYGKEYWLNRNIWKSIRENKTWQEFYSNKI